MCVLEKTRGLVLSVVSGIHRGLGTHAPWVKRAAVGRPYSGRIHLQGAMDGALSQQIKPHPPPCSLQSASLSQWEACRGQLGLRWVSGGSVSYTSPDSWAHALTDMQGGLAPGLPPLHRQEAIAATTGSSIFYVLINYFNSNGLSRYLA